MDNEIKGKARFNLEERLVRFAVEVIRITESLPNSKIGSHLAGQLVRSGTSPALNYGEAQSAESKNDFIHKIKIVLKELRETSISLQIVKQADLCTSKDGLAPILDECNQLISIFVRSVQTAQGRSAGRVH